MTAIAGDLGIPGPRLRTASVSTSRMHLDELLRDHRGRAQWWVELSRHLDDLRAGLVESVDEVEARRGLAAQIRADAPHLIGRLDRLDHERERISDQAQRVRVLAGDYAGDPLAVSAIVRLVRDLVYRVRRYQEHTTEVMLDAYERDIGGE